MLADDLLAAATVMPMQSFFGWRLPSSSVSVQRGGQHENGMSPSRRRQPQKVPSPEADVCVLSTRRGLGRRERPLGRALHLLGFMRSRSASPDEAHSLHTRGVAGSIPASPAKRTVTRGGNKRPLTREVRLENPARLQRVWQRLVPRSQLLTYIRLPDAACAIVVIAASHDGFSRASTSTAPRHWPKPCRSRHQVREATE
jgi:hypothetical protein